MRAELCIWRIFHPERLVYSFHRKDRGIVALINPLMGLCWSFHLDGVVRRNLYIDEIQNTETAGEVALIIERFRDSLPKTRPLTTMHC